MGLPRTRHPTPANRVVVRVPGGTAFMWGGEASVVQRVGQLLRRWGLVAAALASILGLLVWSGDANWQAARAQAAHTARPSPPATQPEAIAGQMVQPQTPFIGMQPGDSAVAPALLSPRPRPETTAEVAADAIVLAYLFSGSGGTTEWIQQTERLHNLSGHVITRVRVPLLPNAFDAHTQNIAGTPTPITGDSVTVDLGALPSGAFMLAEVAYRVPFNFLQVQTWVVPLSSERGLWIALYPQQSYLAVAGKGFRRDPALDPLTGGGLVWSSVAPIAAGTALSWSVVPANADDYPNLKPLPPTPRHCVSASGQPLCQEPSK